MNELHKESSPYLLQHAQNPIHWKAFSQEALDLATKQNKLLVISIGYSTCHWCHVMEHESFNDSQVSLLMNSNFISIKIDREELPDLDAFYMKAVQLMTKQGGWPLNVVCLPDGRPIWGGTYFDKETWIESLKQLNSLFNTKPQEVYQFADKLHQGISVLSKAPTALENQSEFDLDTLLDKWKRSFDWEYGGYSRAPKFMMPNNLAYLQKLGVSSQDTTLLDYVDLTLTKLLYGGIFDTVHGGFFRYSVDFKWHISHFEKMLYDNAQLISLYADAYKRTKSKLYKQGITKTIDFIEKQWNNSKGGYFSALDADSLNKNNQMQEGAYYYWTIDELKDILKQDFDLFSQLFNINSFGLWEKENYILIQNKSIEKIAQENRMTPEELESKKTTWEQLLKTRRDLRPTPFLDDKSLTAWNAMMSIGFFDAYTALQEPSYLEKGLKTLDFIDQNLWSEDSGLFHTYKQDTAKIEAYLDDYAWYISALLKAFQVTLNQDYAQRAKGLMDLTLDRFYDQDQGFFIYTNSHHDIFVASIELEDNVIPSPNSVMVHNLYQLAILYQNQHYNSLCQQITQRVLPHIDYPSYYSNWLLMDLYLNHRSELTITGQHAEQQTLDILSEFIAHSFVVGCSEDSNIPYLKHKFEKNQTWFYLCKDKACLAPTTTIDFKNLNL